MNESALSKSIAEIISDSSEPMDYREIAVELAKTERIAALGVMPYRSVCAIIEEAILQEGDDCPFVKTYPGVYIHRKNARRGHHRDLKVMLPEMAKFSLGIITCYGELWHRDRVDWMQSAQIIGCQFKSSPKVNFAEQDGIYALHLKDKTVTYIGHTGERTLGECLFEHTQDRLDAYFEKFSFYGFRPVFDDGTFGSVPEKADIQDVMASMLSTLVEVASPKANRRYFDKFSQLGFIQCPDPRIVNMREIERHAARI